MYNHLVVNILQKSLRAYQRFPLWDFNCLRQLFFFHAENAVRRTPLERVQSKSNKIFDFICFLFKISFYKKVSKRKLLRAYEGLFVYF